MEEIFKQLETYLKDFEKYYDGCNAICSECPFNKVLLRYVKFGTDYDVCDALLDMYDKYNIK